MCFSGFKEGTMPKKEPATLLAGDLERDEEIRQQARELKAATEIEL